MSPDELYTDHQVVGPQVEFSHIPGTLDPPFPAIFDVDVSDNAILVTLVVDQLPNVVDAFNLIDALHQIPEFKHATLDPASTFAGASQSGIGIASDVITITLSGLSGKAGQFVLVHVTPEPASAALAGIAAVCFFRRRRP